MKAIFLVFFGCVIFAAISCSKGKNVNCSNAQICVQNKSGKVVHYAWDSNMFTDSIMPNGSACKYVGQVVVTNTTTQTPTTYFYSDRINVAITVNTCNQVQVIN